MQKQPYLFVAAMFMCLALGAGTAHAAEKAVVKNIKPVTQPGSLQPNALPHAVPYVDTAGTKPDSPPRIVLSVVKTHPNPHSWTFEMKLAYAYQSSPIRGPATVAITAKWGQARWRSNAWSSGAGWSEGQITVSADHVVTDPITLTIPAGTTLPANQPIGSYTLSLTDDPTPGSIFMAAPFVATAVLSSNPNGTNGYVLVPF